MFGPHFYFDLVRLSRKPRNVLLRCAFLLALLLCWWLVYESGGTRVRVNDFARVATQFAEALLITQGLMILLVTPLFVAGMLVEERTKGTLDMLFATQLTAREILLGKLAARVLPLVLLSLSTWPIVSIIGFWGGVSLEHLALTHVAFLMLIILVSSTSAFASAAAVGYVDAMAYAFAMSGASLFLLYVCAGIAMVLVFLSLAPEPLSLCTVSAGGLVSLAISAAFLAGALHLLKKRRDHDWRWKAAVAKPVVPVKRRRPRGRTRPTIAVTDPALLWKERLDYPSEIVLTKGAVWGLLALPFVVTLVHRGVVAFDNAATQLLAEMIRFIYGGALVLTPGPLVLFIALTAGTVARERERGTLDFLLLLPTPRRETLYWKWVAPWHRCRIMLALMMILPIAGVCGGIFSPSVGILLLLLPWPKLIFLSGVSLLVSVSCARVLYANVILAGVLLAVVLGHLLFPRDLNRMVDTYMELLELDPPHRLDPVLFARAVQLILAQQVTLLLVGIVSLGLAFWRFTRANFEPASSAS